jgi:hypothetical protein
VNVRKVAFLTSSDTLDSSEKFEIVTHGVIVEVGFASEVFVPWSRVLEIWDGRGEIPRT